MMSMKKNSTMTSNMIGNEFRIVDTKLDMLGIWLIVLSGLKILITLMALMSPEFSKMMANQPRMTTMKSRMFQASLR
jgi:hypothetical protein